MESGLQLLWMVIGYFMPGGWTCAAEAAERVLDAVVAPVLGRHCQVGSTLDKN